MSKWRKKIVHDWNVVSIEIVVVQDDISIANLMKSSFFKYGLYHTLIEIEILK